MKAILSMVLVLLCIGASQAQYANRQYAQVTSISASLKSGNSFATEPTRLPGERMKNVGTTLTLCGSALLITGIAVTATTDFDNLVDDDDNINKKQLRHLTYGIELIVFGVGMTVPGIVFWAKGSHKIKRYKREQNITLGTKGAGLSFKYHF